jgi:hypothetical protein
MNQYSIRYGKTSTVILAIIIPSLCFVPGFVSLAYIPDLPDWGLLTLVFVILGIDIVFTLAVVKKLNPKAILTLSDDGFYIEFESKGFPAPRSFDVKTSQIRNCYSDDNNGSYYISFSLDGPPGNFNIGAASKARQDETSFAELMLAVAEMVDRTNETGMNAPGSQPIAAVTMYERTWAKVLVVCIIVVVVAAICMNLLMTDLKTTSWWRIFAAMVIGAPFVYKVYYHNYLKKK